MPHTVPVHQALHRQSRVVTRPIIWLVVETSSRSPLQAMARPDSRRQQPSSRWRVERCCQTRSFRSDAAVHDDLATTTTTTTTTNAHVVSTTDEEPLCGVMPTDQTCVNNYILPMTVLNKYFLLHFFLPQLRLKWCWRHSVVRLYMCASVIIFWKFVNMTSYYKLLVGIHQIYNLDGVREKDDLIRFWGQKVKCQGHIKPHIVK